MKLQVLVGIQTVVLVVAIAALGATWRKAKGLEARVAALEQAPPAAETRRPRSLVNQQTQLACLILFLGTSASY